MRCAPTLAAMVLAPLILIGCGDDPAPSASDRFEAEGATGLAVTSDGNLLIGERASGEITVVDLETGDSSLLATLDGLDPEPIQGGLLGLLESVPGTVLASFTNQDGNLEVAEIDLATGTQSSAWVGPPAEEQANGGRMALLADGSVVIGVGDLLDPAKVDEPDAPNGKVLQLGDGDATVVAGGFNNPFALTSDADGTIWVADNAPGRQQERLVRVMGADVETVAAWDDTRVPSGVAVLDDGRVAICNFATEALVLVDPAQPGDGSGDQVADDCQFAVVNLGGDRVAYATADEVVVLEVPEAG